MGAPPPRVICTYHYNFIMKITISHDSWCLPFTWGVFIGSYLIWPSPNNSPVIISQTIDGIVQLDNFSLLKIEELKTHLLLYNLSVSK